MTKYRNKRTTVDNITFDSKKEAQRYQELKLMERAGVISELELQPKFDLVIDGHKIAKYIADFKYREGVNGKYVIEDVKGIKTPVYKLKAKLVKALYDIEVQEV